MGMQFFKLAIGAVLPMLLAGGAAATTLTFDGLTGSHVPFTTYTEFGLHRDRDGRHLGPGSSRG